MKRSLINAIRLLSPSSLRLFSLMVLCLSFMTLGSPNLFAQHTATSRQTGNWTDNATWSTTRTGTITTLTTDSIVVGVGTLFTTELVAGIVITDSVGTVIGTVENIVSDVTLELTTNAAISLTPGSSYKARMAPAATDNAVIASGHTVTLTATGDIKDITIHGTLNGSSFTLNVSGHWTNNGTFSPGSGTVTFNGAAAQTISGTNTFNNLTINNTSTSDIVDASGSAALAVDGLLHVQDGIFKSKSDFHDVQIDAGATLELSGDINVSGNFTNNGTFLAGSHTVTFDGTSTISGSSTTTFFGVTIAESSSLTGHATLMNVTGNWTNNGTFHHNNGTVAFIGTAGQTIGGTQTTTFNGLTINNTGTSPNNIVSSTNAVTALGLLTIAAGSFEPATASSFAGVTIGSGATFKPASSAIVTVSGNWVNDGTFTHNGGTVELTGAGSVTIGGGASTAFNNLKINKAAASDVVEVLSAITTATTTMAPAGLILTKGVFKLSSASTLSITSIDIPATATFWLNHASAVVNGGNGSYALTGGLRVTHGTLNVGTSTGNSINYFSGSVITVEGGTVNVAGRIARQTASDAATTTYTQSAGTVTVVRSASTSTTRAGFDIGASGSTFNWSGGTIVIQKATSNASDYLIVAGTLNVTGGTLQIGNASTTGSPNIRINSTAPLFHLNVNGAGTPTATAVSNLTLKGDVTIASGGTLDANNQSIFVAGNWSNNGTFSPGSGTVTFNGAAAQTISGTNTFNNLTINNTSTSDIVDASGSAALAVDGLLHVQDGIFKSKSDFHDVQIDAGATLELSGPITVSGHWTNNGTLVHHNYKVTFDGTGAQTLTTGGTGAGKRFYDIEINKSSDTATLAGALGVDRDFILTAGAFSTSASNHAVDVDRHVTLTAGTFTANGSLITVGGNWVNNGATFTAGTSTVTLDGTTAQTVDGSASTTFNDLTVSNTSAPIAVNVNTNVAGTLNMNGAATVLNPSATVVFNSGGPGTSTLTGTGTVKVTGTTGTDDFHQQYKFATRTLTTLTVDYAGAAQGLSNDTYGTLKVSGTITNNTVDATVGTSLNVTGTFTSTAGTITMNNGSSITNSGTLALFHIAIPAAASVTTSSDFTIAGTLSTNANTSSFVASGTSTITMPAGASIGNSAGGTVTFTNLTVAAGSGPEVTSTGNFAVNGTFNISAATFTPDAASIISGTGTLTGNGTVKVTRTAATPDFDSQYTIANTTLTNLTVDYAGIGQVLSNRTYGNLTISGSITSGTNTATVEKIFRVESTGTFTPSGGTITMSTADWDIENNGTLIFSNLTIGATPTTQPSASTFSFSLAGALTVNSGVTLNVTGGTITTTGGTSSIVTTGATSAALFNLTVGTATSQTGTLAINGTLTLNATYSIGSSTLVLNNVVTIGGSGSIASAANGTVEYAQMANGQNVAPGNYGSLTFSGGTKVLPNGGPIGIAGTFTTNLTTGHTITNSTIDYNGSGAQDVALFEYFNLSLSTSGTKTFQAGTTKIAGSLTVSGASGDATTNNATIEYNGAAQTVSAGLTYKHLTLSGTGTKTSGGVITAQGLLTVSTGVTFDLDGNNATVGSLTGDGTISFANAAGKTFTVGSDGTSTTFSGSLSGGQSGDSFVKNGSGTLTLTGDNGTYGGIVNVSAGTLNIQHANALGATSAGTSVASGAVLQVQGGITVAEPLTAGSGFQGTLQNVSGSNTWSGDITLGSTIQVDASSTLEITGQLSGTSGLTKTGDGVLILSNTSNNYTGSTAINAGTLQLGAAGVIPDGSAVTLANAVGAVLDLNGNNETIGTLSGGGTSGGNITLGSGTLTVTQGSDATYAGVISGTGGLTKAGASVLTLSGNNTYSGATTINAGTLQLGASGVIPDGSAVTLANIAGAILDLNNFSETIGTLSGGGTNGGNITLGSGTLTITQGSDATYEGVISGTGGLTKAGASVLTLSGNNTYSGATTVSAGTLNIQHANALGATSAGTSVASGAVLQVQGGITVAEPLTAGSGFQGTLQNVSGSNTWSGDITLGSTIQVDASSTLEITGQLSGTSGLTKTGDGVLILSNTSNNYTGSTAINAGTLQLGAAGVIPDGSAVTVAASATLDLNGNSETVGSLAGAGTVTNGAAGTPTLTAGGNNTSTIFSGTLQNGSGTVSFEKAGTGTLTLSGATVTINALNISAGTLDAGNSTITLTGSGMPFTITGTFVPSASTVTYTGTSATTVAATTYYNLGVNSSGTTFTAGGDITASGVFTVGSASTLSFGTTARTLTLSGTGANTLVNNGTIDMSGSNAAHLLQIAASSLTGLGTIITGTGSTIDYNAAGDQTVVSGGFTYNNLKLSGSGTKTIGTLTVGGDLTLTGAATISATDGTTLTFQGMQNHAHQFIAYGVVNLASLNVACLPGGSLTLVNGATDFTTLTINGALSIPNNGVILKFGLNTARTVTVNGDLSGNGSIDMSDGGLAHVLNLGGESNVLSGGIVPGVGTVHYNRAGAQSVVGTNYYDLTMSNGGTKTLGGAVVVGNNLTVSASTTLVTDNNSLAVVGLTDIFGTLAVTGGTAGDISLNDIKVNSGGSFDNSANHDDVTINGNIVNNGTLTAGTGVYSLGGTSKTLSGTSNIPISNVSITGSYTNNATFVVATSLTGSGSLTQGNNAMLKVGGVFASVTFDAATHTPNTVDYNGSGDQTILPVAYHHLKLSTNGNKSTGGSFTVNGTLTTQDIAVFRVAATHTVTSPATGTITNAASTNIASGGTLQADGLLNNTGGIIVDGTLNIAGTLNSTGTITNNSAATVTITGAVTHMIGNYSGAGTLTFDPASAGQTITFSGTFNSTGTVNFNGGANPIVIAGTNAASFKDVNINNTNATGLIPTNDWTVDGVLTLNNNLKMSTNNRVLTLTANGAVANPQPGGAFDVLGKVRRAQGTMSAGTSYSFNNQYTTMTFSTTPPYGGIPPSDVIVELTTGTAPTPLTAGVAILREYKITKDGTLDPTVPFAASLQLHYQDSELNGNVADTLTLWRLEPTTGGTTYVDKGRTGSVNTADKWVKLDNVQLFSSWTMATPHQVHTHTWVGYASTDWTSPSNWTNGLPHAGDHIIIPAGQPYHPLIPNGLAVSVNSITVQNGGQLNVGSNAKIVLTDYLQIDNGGTVTLANADTVVLGGTFTNNGTLVAGSNNVVTVKGHWINNNIAGATGTGNIVKLLGTSQQNLVGNLTFQKLVVDNAANVALSNHLLVTESLTLTNGKINTDTNSVKIDTGATVTRTNGYVNGNMQKSFSPTVKSFVFHIGDPVTYTPATLVFDSVSVGGNVTARSIPGDHPNVYTNSGIVPNRSVNRYWRLTPSGGFAFTTYSLTVQFAQSDIDVGAKPEFFVIRRYDGTNWFATTNGTRTPTTTAATGITALSDFAVGNQDARTIALTSGDGQQAINGTQVGNPLVVTVRDRFSVTVPDVAVNFAYTVIPPNAANMALTVTDTRTDSAGRASTRATLGNKVGTYIVAATSTGLSGSPVFFNLTALVGVASKIQLVSGNNQTGDRNRPLAAPFVVLVTDLGDNPVPDVSVSFAIASFPADATGQSLSVTGALTGSNGQASTILTLGNRAGTYTVTASSTGLSGSPVTFTAEAVIHTSAENLTAIPTEYQLFQNYPNPFNPSTRIRFGLPEESKVSLEIYNMLGEKVAQIVQGVLPAGYHELEWKPMDFASGSYLLRLGASSTAAGKRFTATKKIVLLK